ERALGSSAHPISDEVLRERIEGSVERWYNPAARTRQETVSFVSHLETARHRHENLEHIDVPTVVAHGTADPLVPVASAHSIAERVPAAGLRLIEGMGHGLPPQVLPEPAEAIRAAADRAE